MTEGKFDSHRRLCPDGACIGVIGDNGVCKVCGRSAAGKEAAPGFVQSQSEDDYGDEDEDEGQEEAGPAATGAGQQKAAAGGAFDPNRRLCPDGSCLGVLGADGVCNVCGQKAD